MLKKGSKVGIVCCSNGQLNSHKSKIELLLNTIRQIGLVPVCSDYIYQNNSVFSGTGKERAQALMEFYCNDDIEIIFDISGGDIANEVLRYLDFDIIGSSTKMFCGYSDLTTIINAIYAKTGKASGLYQLRNLIYDNKEKQIQLFTDTMILGTTKLFEFSYDFIQGKSIDGIVVGGNIRCLLKLAGTEYWPDFEGKIIFLESSGGTVAQMVTYLSQLEQMDVFKKIKGVILGTFTKMEEEKCKPSIVELVQRYVESEVPIAKTKEIGHGNDSKCILIGERIKL